MAGGVQIDAKESARSTPRWQSITWRVPRTIAITALIVAALITFPSSIPWTIGVWILWHAVRVAQGHSGWLPLAICAAIIIVKRTPLPPGMIALAAVAAGVEIL